MEWVSGECKPGRRARGREEWLQDYNMYRAWLKSRPLCYVNMIWEIIAFPAPSAKKQKCKKFTMVNRTWMEPTIYPSCVYGLHLIWFVELIIELISNKILWSPCNGRPATAAILCGAKTSLLIPSHPALNWTVWGLRVFWTDWSQVSLSAFRPTVEANFEQKEGRTDERRVSFS